MSLSAIRGGLQGGLSMAPAAFKAGKMTNPWLLGAGVLGGGLLGFLSEQEDEEFAGLRDEFNRENLLQTKQATRLGNITERSARRGERDTLMKRTSKDIVGQQLASMFKALR